MRLLRAADRVAKPWKNGGGVTRDVVTWPEGAGMEAFHARVSLADVAGDGPFSLFPGIDRTTAILSGTGFGLAVEGLPPARLTPDAAPFSYPGDRAAASRLIEGAVTDLNLMTRRGVVRHTLRRTEIERPVAISCAGMSLLLVAEGVAIVDKLRLGALDAVVSDDPVVWQIAPDGAATIWIAEFLTV